MLKKSHRARYNYREVPLPPREWARLKAEAAVHKLTVGKYCGFILRHQLNEPRQILIYPEDRSE